MTELHPTPAPEELGYFYDTIHGRVSLEEFPEQFRRTLKAALSSRALTRLKRISQLGHTSVSFFSATHTRFSHAIGTMLVMAKLFRQVRERGLSPSVFSEVIENYPVSVAAFGDVHVMVYCHLLLTALYQDTGELPFQKVSSSHFVPVEEDVTLLVNVLPQARPRQWHGKQVFSVLSLLKDFRDAELKSAFAAYDFDFVAYLMTGDGAPVGSQALSALLQMVDGVVDADRLDYVYRDASATIGALSRPSTVLESVVAYEPGRVIVNDSRPVTDFLSTRMRLWTFVYSSADVRFRQALLKTVLDAHWDGDRTEAEFKARELDPELSYERFASLDDNSLMDAIELLDDAVLGPCRRDAKSLLLRGALDYECRVLTRGMSSAALVQMAVPNELPASMFFDLLSDHGPHQLYRTDSVFVRQGLTSRIAATVRLEESAGAFSRLFSGDNSAMIVKDGYYVFLPRERQGRRWLEVEEAIVDGALFPMVAWEDARRGIPPTDTRTAPGFSSAKAISISYCSKDFPIVVRIVRELHRRKRRYHLFLRPFDGTGDTPARNSEELIGDAEAVLAIVSTDYLRRATDGGSYIAIEVRAIHERAREIPVIPVGVDRREELDAVPNWDWAQMNEAWRGNVAILPADFPLRTASEEILRAAVDAVLKRC